MSGAPKIVAGRGLLGQGGLAFGGLMLANVLNYLFYTLVSRRLGVEGYATFSALLAAVLMISAPALVAQTVVAKLVTDALTKLGRADDIIAAVARGSRILAIGGALAMAAAAPLVVQFLRLDDVVLVFLAAVSLFSVIALPFQRGALQGLSAFGSFALSNVFEGLGKAVLAPVFAAKFGLRGAFVGMALGYGVAYGYGAIVMAARHAQRMNRLRLRDLFRNSVTVGVAVLAINSCLLFDAVLAKRYLGTYDAGLYGAVALASRALYAATAFVSVVLLPQTALRSAAGRQTGMLLVQAAAVVLLMAGLVLGFAALEPVTVVSTIAGHDFAPGAPLLFPYLVAMTALSMVNLFAAYNIGRGRLGFVWALLAVAAGEILSIVWRHGTAQDFLQTIIIGHTLAVLTCFISFGPSARRGATDVSDERNGP